VLNMGKTGRKHVDFLNPKRAAFLGPRVRVSVVACVIHRALSYYRGWWPQPLTRLREKLIMIGAKAVSHAVRRGPWLF